MVHLFCIIQITLFPVLVCEGPVRDLTLYLLDYQVSIVNNPG
jgi:hypothetical protein